MISVVCITVLSRFLCLRYFSLQAIVHHLRLVYFWLICAEAAHLVVIDLNDSICLGATSANIVSVKINRARRGSHRHDFRCNSEHSGVFTVEGVQ